MAYHVTLIDDLALVTCSHSGALASVDVSDPAQPQLQDVLDLGDIQGERTCCRENLALTATWDGLRIIDISNPDSLLQLGSLSGTTGGYGVGFTSAAFAADWAVATDDTALVTIDVSSPGSPIILDRLETADIIYGLWVDGGRIYVANRYNGLGVVDITSEGTMIVRGQLDLPEGNARDVAVRSGLAYVASSEGESLYVVDVSNPADMEVVWSYGSGTSKGLCLGPEEIYLLQGAELTILE